MQHETAKNLTVKLPHTTGLAYMLVVLAGTGQLASTLEGQHLLRLTLKGGEMSFTSSVFVKYRYCSLHAAQAC